MKPLFPILLILLFMGGGCSSKPKVPQPDTAHPPQTAVTDATFPSGKFLGPLDSIKELDNKIASYKSGVHLTPEEIEANNKLKEDVIRGTFDIYELSRVALDSHWNKLGDKERTYFSNLMINLLEKKAILSKEQVKSDNKPYQISYRKEEVMGPDKKMAMVWTAIDVPSEKVSLNVNYKLLLTTNGWKIFDVIVDDASLVENYKFQFDTIIQKYGYPELVSRMEQKLKEMD